MHAGALAKHLAWELLFCFIFPAQCPPICYLLCPLQCPALDMLLMCSTMLLLLLLHLLTLHNVHMSHWGAAVLLFHLIYSDGRSWTQHSFTLFQLLKFNTGAALTIWCRAYMIPFDLIFHLHCALSAHRFRCSLHSCANLHTRAL